MRLAHPPAPLRHLPTRVGRGANRYRAAPPRALGPLPVLVSLPQHSPFPRCDPPCGPLHTRTAGCHGGADHREGARRHPVKMWSKVAEINTALAEARLAVHVAEQEAAEAEREAAALSA